MAVQRFVEPSLVFPNRFTGLAETTVKHPQIMLGPSEREKRMLRHIEVERQSAKAELHWLREVIPCA